MGLAPEVRRSPPVDRALEACRAEVDLAARSLARSCWLAAIAARRSP